MELVLDFSGERWRYDVDITARVRGRIDRELQDGGCTRRIEAWQSRVGGGGIRHLALNPKDLTPAVRCLRCKRG